MTNTTRKPAMAAKATAATKAAKPDAAPAVTGDGAETGAGGKAMNRVDLISAVAAEVDLPKNKAGEAVDAVLQDRERDLNKQVRPRHLTWIGAGLLTAVMALLASEFLMYLLFLSERWRVYEMSKYSESFLLGTQQ